MQTLNELLDEVVDRFSCLSLNDKQVLVTVKLPPNAAEAECLVVTLPNTTHQVKFKLPKNSQRLRQSDDTETVLLQLTVPPNLVGAPGTASPAGTPPATVRRRHSTAPSAPRPEGPPRSRRSARKRKVC